MIAAIRCEAVKAARSLVGIIALVAYVGGVTALCSVVIALARSGDTQLIAKLGSSVTDDWAGLVSAAAQIAGAGGFVASGVVASWIFAREFADRTISRLFALPVSRGRIAIAKTAVFALWNLAAAVLILALLLIAGTALGLGAPSPDEWAALVRIPVLVVLTALAVLPVAVGGLDHGIPPRGDRLGGRAPGGDAGRRALGFRRLDALRRAGPVGDVGRSGRDNRSAGAHGLRRCCRPRRHRRRVAPPAARPLSRGPGHARVFGPYVLRGAYRVRVPTGAMVSREVWSARSCHM